jgi:hypothetical protein
VRIAGGVLLVAAGAVAAGFAPDLRAQSADEWAETCADAGGDSALCGATAVAARAILGDLALAAGQGSEVAGTASNLGQRLGTTPRIAFGARVGTVRTAVPDVFTGSGLGESSFLLTSVSVDVAAGLFDGFRVMPTVGGFLALDVYGRLGLVLTSAEEGFSGQNTTYSFGARIGIVRESFTLPGVSLSISRRFVGDVTFGGRPIVGDPARIWLGPSTTSLRATVGKDLFAVEVLAGVGWDDLSAAASYEIRSASGPGYTVQGTNLDAKRRIYFASASRSFNVVFTLSLEAGVARGFDPVPRHVGSFDPERSSLFGSVALRLTI